MTAKICGRKMANTKLYVATRNKTDVQKTNARNLYNIKYTTGIIVLAILGFSPCFPKLYFLLSKDRKILDPESVVE